MLRQARRLRFKHHIAGQTAVNGQLDAIGDQSPSDAVVFRTLAKRRIALCLTLHIDNVDGDHIFTDLISSQGHQFANPRFQPIDIEFAF